MKQVQSARYDLSSAEVVPMVVYSTEKQDLETFQTVQECFPTSPHDSLTKLKEDPHDDPRLVSYYIANILFECS